MPYFFYVVKAVCGGADMLALSAIATAVTNQVGEFDFAIAPGN